MCNPPGWQIGKPAPGQGGDAMARAYYNERDPYAAAWLENLIAAGEIAPGDVDTRDILDVRPADLDGYTQCHFFAGIGIWSAALRAAGWPDDRPVWTGSCPCQPFSAAGAGHGFNDERHLFPGWHWLIEQCRPETVFGEQVASADGLVWADAVQAAMEATGYAGGIVDTCAAGFGAFHIRQRLYFAAEDQRLAADRLVDAASARLHRRWSGEAVSQPAASKRVTGRGDAGGLVYGIGTRPQGHGGDGHDRGQPGRNGAGQDGPTASSGTVSGVADTYGGNSSAEREQPGWEQRLQPVGGRRGQRVANADGQSKRGRPTEKGQTPSRYESQVRLQDGQRDGPGLVRGRDAGRPGTTDPRWADADWLFCRDGKWRPVEPGTFPLAHGATARMGRLRAYGNGLDLAQATGFVRAYLERHVGAKTTVAGDLFEWGA